MNTPLKWRLIKTCLIDFANSYSDNVSIKTNGKTFKWQHGFHVNP